MNRMRGPPVSDDIRISRGLATNPWGKCDQEIKVHLPEDSKEALTALAFAAGMTLSEYTRHVLQCHVHGHAAVLRGRMRGAE